MLPTGKRIEFVLASSDVIHSFWVPEFLFKRDVNPNPKENHSDNVFQISDIEQEGAFVGRCAEMCGTYPRDDELRGPRCDAGEFRAVHRGSQAVDEGGKG